MDEPTYYLNGKFVPKGKANISVHDLGLLRGYGVFDFLITYNNGRPFLLKRHLERLRVSAKLIDLTIPWNSRELSKTILSAINKNKNGREKAVRIVVTGGESGDSISANAKPTIIIIVNDKKLYPPKYYKEGIKVTTFEHERENPYAKSLNYCIGIKALTEGRKKGAVEAIYISHKLNRVYEGVTSNIFIVKNKQLITPGINTLEGITRELILKLSARKVTTHIQNVKINEMLSADEVFLTASNKEIMPIVKIDNKMIGNGKPGPITQMLMLQYDNFVKKNKW